MRKIINGRKYDTETATEIETYNNGKSYTDFSYVEETLYKKKTGEFFLAGSTGAFGRFAHRSGVGCYCKGSGIAPLSIDEAKEWCENHLDVEKYEELFGEVAE